MHFRIILLRYNKNIWLHCSLCVTACVSPEMQARGVPAARPSSREEQGKQEAQGQFRHHQGAERQHEETG